MKPKFLLLLIISFLIQLNSKAQTVADIVVGSPDHNTLEAALGAAGLVNTLNGAGPFTVFAPTDAAFSALPAGTVQALLADPGGALTDILLYHVVGAKALYTDLSNDQRVVTLEDGKTVKSHDQCRWCIYK
ncbi:MAG: fasciclin domain-containing protein [Saprospiraceae bacterium]|nr:fasciclin domain-containing protein [Saprospiraceae bacterium]